MNKIIAYERVGEVKNNVEKLEVTCPFCGQVCTATHEARRPTFAYILPGYEAKSEPVHMWFRKSNCGHLRELQFHKEWAVPMYPGVLIAWFSDEPRPQYEDDDIPF